MARQTKLQLVTSTVAEVEEAVKWLKENEAEWATERAQQLHQKTCKDLKVLEAEMPSMKSKALEANPDKRTYSKTMSEKVNLSLHKREFGFRLLLPEAWL